MSTATSAGAKTIASNALKRAGLVDSDTKMRDVSSDNPGGRKSSSRRAYRSKPIDAFKDRGPGSSSSKHMLVTRMEASAPLSIRGAARGSTIGGRLRRNAVSTSTSGGNPVTPMVRVKRAPPLTSTVQVWRDLVQKRYNADARFLDLSKLHLDETLEKNNLKAPGHGGAAKECAVLFKLAKELKPSVLSLDLSGNDLNGPYVSSLGHYLPDLQNLSLQDNKFTVFKDVDCLFGKRKEALNKLRELILVGNPLRDIEVNNGRESEYRNKVSRLFPALHMLDQAPIAQIAFDAPQTSLAGAQTSAPTATEFPVDMGASLISGVNPELVINFLARFFQSFDSQRATLADVYDPLATFSYQCNTSIPERARIKGLQHTLPNQKKLAWSEWLDNPAGGSRNLQRVGKMQDRAEKRLHVGGEAVVRAIVALPQTKHDITGPAEMFCIDCFPVVHGAQMGLMLTVHGQFTELPAEGIRSFDRTFILLPAPDGSRAKMAGWEVMVIADQWNIRGYSHHEAWTPGPMLVQAKSSYPRKGDRMDAQATPETQVLPQLPPDQQAALASIPEPQKSSVIQVIERTGLNVKYSVDCLTGNNWELERAVANFLQVKDTLPRDAYL